jgi:hypothetical protein
MCTLFWLGLCLDTEDGWLSIGKRLKEEDRGGRRPYMRNSREDDVGEGG